MGFATRFGNLKIGARLAAGFGVVLALMLVLVTIAVGRVGDISTGLTTINDVNSVKQRYAINFRGSVHDRAISLRDVTLVADAAALAPVLADIDRLSADYAKSAEQLDRMFAERTDITAEERAILADIKGIEARTLPLIQKVVALRQAGDDAQAKALLMSQARPAFVDWLARINVFIDLQEKMNQAQGAQARSVAQGFAALMTILALAAVVAGVLVAWAITRQLTRALGAEPAEVKRVADAVARGELSDHVPVRAGDEQSIMASLARMHATLRGIVQGVRDNAENLANASAEISQGNADLSRRTEQQASALEQTAASMEEFASTVRQNADNAAQANALAAGASEVAVQGGEVVGQVVSTIKEINDSSKQIADIIGVIDGIAFQTNILALNAAVEAARAGDHGRGFAVVASEVRSLAQRSATAAKEIKTLITTSVERVEQGTILADRAGETMREAVSSIRRVTDVVGEITAATREQSAGIGEVSEAVTRMDQMTQQNAALVEESAAAAQSLSEQANQLLDQVAVFKLGNDSRRVASPAPDAAKTAAVAPGTPARAPLAAKRDDTGAGRIASKGAVTRLARTRAAADKPALAPVVATAAVAAGSDDWTAF